APRGQPRGRRGRAHAPGERLTDVVSSGVPGRGAPPGPGAWSNVARDVRSEEMVVNMGPQHPATHGVLRVAVKTDGETVLDCEPMVGNLHRCKEKIAEGNQYFQFMPYTDRLDYLAAMNNEECYARAVEKLCGLKLG